MLSAGLLTLVMIPFQPGWAGILVGCSIAVFGGVEVWGWSLLRQGNPHGLVWAQRSQVGVFTTIALYSLGSFTQVSPDVGLDLLTPGIQDVMMQLYQIDREILGELLVITVRVVYITLILVSALYQGGLWLFYRSRRPMLLSQP